VNEWDLIIVGGGPAGLTSALYGARSGLSTLLLEERTAGGYLSEIPLVENYPGFSEGISGLDLAAKMIEQTKRAGAEIREIEIVESVGVNGQVFIVKTDKASYSCRALILATGTRRRPLGVKGEEQLRGRGVSYCALCDGAFFKGKKVAVVGGGNAAASSALYMTGIASEVCLIHRRNEFRAEEAMIKPVRQKGVRFILNSEVIEIKGEGKLRSIVLRNKEDGQCSEIDVDGLFVEFGEIPNNKLAQGLGVKLDNEGFILVDHRQQTSIAGVFAAGDVTYQSVKQISTAVGQGALAATEAFAHIKRL
jgi:thioredoxin reductase (NADPH)